MLLLMELRDQQLLLILERGKTRVETGNLVSNHVSGVNLHLSDLMTDEHDSEVDSCFLFLQVILDVACLEVCS